MTTPPLGQFPAQQAQAARDVNTASLCRIGQETVQDIVLRTMEIFQLLRNMQLPNGVTYHPNTHQDRLGKLQEHLRMLSVLFRKLRLVYDKCNENCAGLEPIPPEKTIGTSLSHSSLSSNNSPPALYHNTTLIIMNTLGGSALWSVVLHRCLFDHIISWCFLYSPCVSMGFFLGSLLSFLKPVCGLVLLKWPLCVNECVLVAMQWTGLYSTRVYSCLMSSLPGI
ncbi:mediator of RNA polymerase II transcription subunit 30 isoform X1 [Tachysurus fulvidraco]|uniref:mediator of RNA polymerase II transcription subunit 30 isoform X1 n=1 Tax=Tachysurus fulvidraco TaxID=1234273 RepID=UPI001FEE0FF6|nr:mediator of RNA polymerase II transcription subunit 30 isoform X1 [Tachysurus fulvidraco]XP_047663972.1 mediator of RNA polymerase II transcription subunit 30 isoform X1 [Tachysurus fulvidraco]